MNSRSPASSILFAVLAFWPMGAATQQMIAFVNVTVVPMDHERMLAHQTVLVRGDRIAEVGAADHVHPPRDSFIIDGRNRFLIPGLTDSHVHFSGYLRAGAGDHSIEENTLLLLLANGITTAINMEGSPPILALRDEVARGVVLGPKLYSAGPLIQMPNSGELPGRRTFTTPDEIRTEVLAEKKAGYDFVKIHGELPEDTYRTLLETARRAGIRVVGHVPDNLGIDAALNGNQELIVHAEDFIYSYFEFHRDLPRDSAEIDKLVREIAAKTARAGKWVSPTLSVFRQIIFQVADVDALLERPEMHYMPRAAITDWFPPNNPYVKRWRLDQIPKLRAQYVILQRLVRGLRDAGVPLLAGTDPFVPCQLPGFSMKDELEQLYAAGLTPFEALQSATSNPSRFLHSDGESGTVSSGKIADLVLLEANPLDDVDNVFRRDGVMLRGRWFPETELQARLSQLAAARH